MAAQCENRRHVSQDHYFHCADIFRVQENSFKSGLPSNIRNDKDSFANYKVREKSLFYAIMWTSMVYLLLMNCNHGGVLPENQIIPKVEQNFTMTSASNVFICRQLCYLDDLVERILDPRDVVGRSSEDPGDDL